ncbi:MAG: hypothetical protein D5S00_10365 [Tindallia sp. MSAO_Bac2]|nr:MAG: hypothetical protein D5S00_10365 [Tindallia sp. MSAO_Bac2]
MTRKELYDEIWEKSVSGVAKKYGIPYAIFMKQVKLLNIPIPPPGYWTKISFGKSVLKIDLPEPIHEVITIYKTAEQINNTRNKNGKAGSLPDAPNTPSNGDEHTPLEETRQNSNSNLKESESNLLVEHPKEPETFERYGQTYNVYNRETLYNEVWERPVIEVAKRYKVSDVTIHKVCKSMNIPTPPAGFWAKLRAGKPVTKMPLPGARLLSKKTGLRTGTTYDSNNEGEKLGFLSTEDRDVIFSIASQISLPEEKKKMHPKIIAHRKKTVEWIKEREKRKKSGWNMRAMEAAPFLADTVSEETLPRVFLIFDALISVLEPLGCSLTDDLKFVVNGEKVAITIKEAKDKNEHVLTKEDNIKLLKYEDEKRRYSWASKPNIPKYDHVYNGRISMMINRNKWFRDTKTSVVEERLGDVLIELYEAADTIRRDHEAYLEAQRKRHEEERLEEERKVRYNNEVDRTIALTNLADDFDTAMKIRRYIAMVESADNVDEDMKDWIEWAKAKADWYDPVVAKEDELLGTRKHKEDIDKKKLRKEEGRWW